MLAYFSQNSSLFTEENKIPLFHHQAMRDLIGNLTFDDYGPLIAKEINELEINKAPIQKAILFITAREEWLKNITQTIEEIDNLEQTAKNQEQTIDKVEHSMKLLISLRYLSIDWVESIIEWRERLNYLISKIPNLQSIGKHYFIFIWDHENYLIKMKTDTLFLKTSWLSRFFLFSSKSDPFLYAPSQIASYGPAKVVAPKKPLTKKKTSKAESAKPKLIRLDIDYGIIRKLKQLELVIVEESVFDSFIASNITTGTSQEEAKLQIEDQSKDEKPAIEQP